MKKWVLLIIFVIVLTLGTSAAYVQYIFSVVRASPFDGPLPFKTKSNGDMNRGVYMKFYSCDDIETIKESLIENDFIEINKGQWVKKSYIKPYNISQTVSINLKYEMEKIDKKTYSEYLHDYMIVYFGSYYK